MADFTLDDLSRFTQNERKMVEEVFPELDHCLEPSEESIHRILDFSRAYSVRRSKEFGPLRMVLN